MDILGPYELQGYFFPYITLNKDFNLLRMGLLVYVWEPGPSQDIKGRVMFHMGAFLIRAGQKF
jgi:hypothetical protein